MDETLSIGVGASNLASLSLNEGSATLPSMSFTADTTTGFWLPSVGTVALAINGINKLTATSSVIELDFPGVSLLEQAEADVSVPSSSTRHMLYIDSTSKHLVYKNSNASIIDLTYADSRVGSYLGTLTGLTAPSGSDFTITTSANGRLAVNPESSYPTLNNHVATKEYVDNYAAGLKVHTEVKTKTTANLTATYHNGVSGVGATLTSTTNASIGTINGYALSLTDRILIMNQDTTYQNGIYIVTQLGSGLLPWILTRAGDLDGSPSYEVTHGVYTFIASGDDLGKGFVLATPSASITGPNNTILIGTDPLIWAQFAGAASSSGTLTPNRLLGTDVLSVISGVNLSSYVAGTVDQITSTDNAAGGITLSLPQSIAATSSPTFASATLSGTTADTLLYSNGSKVISSVTIGTGLSLTSGTLASTSTLPQDLATTASPTFAGLTFGSLTSTITTPSTTRTTAAIAKGIQIDIPVTVTAGSTLTNFYGLHLSNTGAVNLNTTGAITTGYSLYVANPAFGATKYAAYFGGDVKMGRILQCASLNSNTNISIGPDTMRDSTTTGDLVAIGAGAYKYNTSGSGNIAIGTNAMLGYAAGAPNGNTVVGYGSGPYLETNGDYNVAVGWQSGISIATGKYNTVIGYLAGLYLKNGSNNTCIGSNTTIGSAGITNISGNILINASTNNSVLTSVYASCIYLNSTSGAKSTAAANQLYLLTGARGGCYIDSIKNTNDQTNFLEYNSATNEITYGNSIASLAVSGNTTLTGLFVIGSTIATDKAMYNAKSLSAASGSLYGYMNDSNLYASSATVAATYHAYINPGHTGNVGTITDAYGMYVAAGTTAGTITNGYGLYVANPAFGTNKYAAYFGGDVVAQRILNSAISGGRCIAIGFESLFTTTGNATDNVAIGQGALKSNTNGQDNIAIGTNALSTSYSNSTYNQGSYNIAIGTANQYRLTTGLRNVGIGAYNMSDITTGSDNIAMGYLTGYSMSSTSSQNILIGTSVVNSGGISNNNTVIGFNAMYSAGSGSNNSCLGHKSGYNITTGQYNTFIGIDGGKALTTGSNNTCLGAKTTLGTAVVSNILVNASFDNSILTSTFNNCIYLNATTGAKSSGEASQLTISTGARGGCFIDSIKAVNDQANFLEYNTATNEITYGTTIASSAKYKENIQPADNTFLDVFNTVDVKKFDYNDKAAAPYTNLKDVHGMIAEEVEAVFPFACKYTTNKEGIKELFTIKYELLVIPLWHMVKQLKKEIDELRSSMQTR